MKAVKKVWRSIIQVFRVQTLHPYLLGNFGDCEPVGEGVFEMRIHIGPGYRVYYTRRDRTVYLLLTGGDKSTQKKDIERAKRMAREIEENEP